MWYVSYVFTWQFCPFPRSSDDQICQAKTDEELCSQPLVGHIAHEVIKQIEYGIEQTSLKKYFRVFQRRRSFDAKELKDFNATNKTLKSTRNNSIRVKDRKRMSNSTSTSFLLPTGSKKQPIIMIFVLGGICPTEVRYALCSKTEL